LSQRAVDRLIFSALVALIAAVPFRAFGACPGFTQKVTVLPGWDNVGAVAIGDFNGDGRPDLATANWSTNNASVLLRNADGTYVTASNNPTGANPFDVAIGDVNGDGKADLAVSNDGSNNASILLGNGDGTFAAAVNYATGAGPP